MVSGYLHLLGMLCAASSAFALAVPVPDVGHAQTPLLGPQQHAKASRMGVLIAFRRSGEEYERTVQVQLGQPLRGSVLHTDATSGARKGISSIKIVSVLDMETAASTSVEGLDRVRCRVAPRFSFEEERAASAAGVELGKWPAFGAEEGVIVLDRSESRWYLAGRAVESVECW